MIEPIVIGIMAAVIVAVPRFVRVYLPGAIWASPILILGIAVVAMLLQRFILDRKAGQKNYDGLADLFVHVHTSSNVDSPVRWTIRGAVSFLLTLFGGTVGPEGAAVETTHGFAIAARSRSSRWFEQRRRTDAATALSAGVAAAFGAPFAAILFPIELGVGGRSLSIAMSALTAFLGIRFIGHLIPPEKLMGEGFDIAGALYGFHFADWRQWFGVIFIGLLAGAVCALVIRFVRYSRESLLELFQTQAWMRILAGGILLFLVILVYRSGHAPSWTLLEQTLWSRKLPAEVGLLFLTQLLSIALVLSAFGTIGVLWPFFALGGFFGFGIDHLVFNGIPGFAAVAGLSGAVAFWGALMGAPLAGAVLCFELTQNIYVLIPCLLAGFLARQVRSWFKTRSLVDKDLEARGIALVDGRSAAVLDSIYVRDAMVTDFEVVQEKEPVSELYARLGKLRYPFLPVVNGQNVYIGMLTVDMVQEGWQAQDPQSSNSSLANLLEAKDLLYRARFKVPTVKASDRLSVTAGIFEEIPCVPVQGDDGRVSGLLFVYNVRLAYDREVARRSLLLLHQPLT